MSSPLALGARVACVFALLALLLWVLKRTGGLGMRRRAAPLQVLSTTRLSKSAMLSVVRVHDEEHVLAVTGSGVTVVSSRPHAEEAEGATEPAADATAPEAAPAGPPSAAQFLRGGWRVLRSRPVETNDLDDDEVAAALARACAPSPAFADDLAAALQAVEPGEPVAVPLPRTADDAPARRTPRRAAPRRLRTAQEGSL